ncbi:hypothetical protein NEF87_001294 [Candidatus Lokiarchaeum ossiferum]|uniref:DUF4184 family protein n=1 Tax=Candidatus Lokiarchaeum ossiferum TaxID=2951803 RepID=A0ABY6HNB7_9ARCH|nr:hypothetical protein NEF87_001294 [Candidatus Lokiarchaeum sp. B-35]
MPTFGHIVYGLCVLIPILYFARERFSYKLAFIFLMTNIFGPDITFLFGFIETGVHYIIGYIIVSIPLALVFSYISRFKMERSSKGFPLTIMDEGIKEISWKNAFCASAAGGISHFFIDQMFHRELEMHVFPGIDLQLQDIMEWSGDLYHTMNPIMVIGEAIVVGMIIFSLFYLRKGYKETFIVFGIGTVLSIVLMLISTEIYGGEREYAVIFCCVIYFLIPMFLLFYAARDVLDHPVEAAIPSKMPAKTRLNIISSISLLLGVIMLAYGVVALTMSDVLVDLIGDSMDVTGTQLEILGIYYGSISLILVIGSIGLFFKNRICRYMVIFSSTYFLIFAFPLGIAFFLFEKDVKALFVKEE